VQKIDKKEPRASQIIIDKTLGKPERIEVAVPRAGDRVAIDEYMGQVLDEIARRWPESVITRVPLETPAARSHPSGHKRGGPASTPERQRIEIVREWLDVQGRVNQEVYAQAHGISTATLRRWIHQLRQAGKL